MTNSIHRLLAFCALLILPSTQAQTNLPGVWLADDLGLPCFELTATPPIHAQLKDGTPANLPADPWCLLGNYRFKLLAHASGNYQLITAQRAWGRLNQGETPGSSFSASSVDLLDAAGKTTRSWTLAGGSNSASPITVRPVFGCGFAAYAFDTETFSGQRTFSIKPSTTPYNGASAFLLTVKIKNKGTSPLSLSWRESVAARYETLQQQNLPASNRVVQYSNTVTVLEDRQCMKTDFQAIASDPLLFPARDTATRFEGFPPSLFVKFATAGFHPEFTSQKLGSGDRLDSRVDFALQPGEEKTFDWVIGYSFDSSIQAIEKSASALLEKAPGPGSGNVTTTPSGAAYGALWLKALPKFESETDPALRRELIWHATVLESLAAYSEYFNETRIPEGGFTSFGLGEDGTIRILCENALPLCRYNPGLARSSLKYIMKHALPSGEILAFQTGNGFCDNHGTFPSDLQLHYYQLLNEYLLATQDFDFLLELADAYPAKRMPRANSLDLLERTFRHLRNEIGVGPHGLMRLMNSDWNAAIYSNVALPYNAVLHTGESPKNTAMAIRVLGDLCETLDRVQANPSFTSSQSQIKGITESMRLFRKGLLDALTTDLGDRVFARRLYLAGKPLGETNLYLEPQVELLRLPGWSADRKKALYAEIKTRLMTGETIGARQVETPEWDNGAEPKGSAENGGVWYSLNGPLIIGVASWDKAEAAQLLKRLSLENLSKTHPSFWSAWWSASTSLDSSLLPTEGLPAKSALAFPVYSAAPHAWILEAYQKLTPAP